jgi:hypothetical protein
MNFSKQRALTLNTDAHFSSLVNQTVAIIAAFNGKYVISYYKEL